MFECCARPWYNNIINMHGRLIFHWRFLGVGQERSIHYLFYFIFFIKMIERVSWTTVFCRYCISMSARIPRTQNPFQCAFAVTELITSRGIGSSVHWKQWMRYQEERLRKNHPPCTFPPGLSARAGQLCPTAVSFQGAVASSTSQYAAKANRPWICASTVSPVTRLSGERKRDGLFLRRIKFVELMQARTSSTVRHRGIASKGRVVKTQRTRSLITRM